MAACSGTSPERPTSPRTALARRLADRLDPKLYNANDRLVYAAEWGEMAGAEAALRDISDVNKLHAERDTTALGIALDSGRYDVAQLILEHPSVDVSVKTNRVSPFYKAADQNRELWVRLLSRTTDKSINERCTIGGTPLIYAAEACNEELVCSLLKRQADVLVRGGWHNMTPLEHAARKGDGTIAKLLLQNKAEEQIQQSPGLLAIAAESGNVEMADLLCKRGADVNAEYPSWTAADIQFDSKMEDGQDSASDSDESEPLPDELRWPNRGRTAIVIAVKNKAPDLVEWLLNRDEIRLNNVISEEAVHAALLCNTPECLLRLLRSPKVELPDDYLNGRRWRRYHYPHDQVRKLLERCVGKPATEYQQALQNTRLEDLDGDS